MKIECPNCGYSGGDLTIGENPISEHMMCKKCKRYFNPFAGHLQLKINPNLQEELKNNKDCILVIDGKEGQGMSTMAFKLA